MLDLDYLEDSCCDTDMNVVMTGDFGLVEVQGTAEGVSVQPAGAERHAGSGTAGNTGLGRDSKSGIGSKMSRATEIQKLVIASGNAGKLREIRHLLEPLGIEVLPQSALNIPEVEEPYCTFLENALAKARHASKSSGLPTLADDSGICVNALNGGPGVYSARYAGNPDRMSEIIRSWLTY